MCLFTLMRMYEVRSTAPVSMVARGRRSLYVFNFARSSRYRMAVNEFQLIDLIHSRPEVWDTNSVQFRNKHIKSGAWRDIAQMLGTTVEECQITWKKLRDRYTRIKRMLPSGSEGGRKSWDKEELLRFLDKILVTRRTTSSAVEKMSESSFTTTNSVEASQELQQINEEEQETIHQENIEEFYEINHSDNAVHILESVSATATSSASPMIVIPSDTNTNYGNEQDDDLLTPKSSMKRKKNKNKKECITQSLITAINKVSDNEETQNIVVEDVNESFLRYHGQQARELLSNKNINVQRRIRNRLSAFIDELYEEFNE